MGLFVSYSSQDRAAVEVFAAALRRARQQVWLDEELGGGEAWWSTILGKIRTSDVFILALSNNSLTSKPCQAELAYAKALGRPILPVQIGPVDSMRVNVVADRQTVDYQHPTADTGIELISAVHTLASQRPPLPDPLPPEPGVPFAYLMRLAATVNGPELGPREQTQLLAELKAGLDEDGADPTARQDISLLLRMLHDRSDITWRTRTEIDGLLANADTGGHQAPPHTAETPLHIQPGPTYAPPPPLITGPQHIPMSFSGQPPPPSSRSNKKWVIGGGVAAALVAVIVIIAVVWPHPKPNPPPPKPPTVTAAQLDSVLLNAADVNAIMGATDMEKIGDTIHGLDTSGATELSNPACLGARMPIQGSVYKGSGYSASSAQVFREPGDSWDHNVAEAAIAFPSAEQARAFVDSSATQWKACQGQTVGATNKNETVRWTFGDTVGNSPSISQINTKEGDGGWTCQRVLSATGNLVTDVSACGYHITNEGNEVAKKMAAKVPA